MHHIRLQAKTAIIEAKLIGYFSLFEVNAYTAAVEPIIRRLAARGGYRMLIDVTRCAIQSDEVIRAFEQHVARVEPARRLAVVTADYVVRMQVRRVLKSPGVGIFVDRDEALAWLDQRKEPRLSAAAVLGRSSDDDESGVRSNGIAPLPSTSRIVDQGSIFSPIS